MRRAPAPVVGPRAADAVLVGVAEVMLDGGPVLRGLKAQRAKHCANGEVTFTIDEAYLPFNHTRPVIRDLYLVVETVPGVSPSGLVVSVKSPEISVNGTSDANGLVFEEFQHVIEDSNLRIPVRLEIPGTIEPDLARIACLRTHHRVRTFVQDDLFRRGCVSRRAMREDDR
jgi:hypothetical protein